MPCSTASVHLHSVSVGSGQSHESSSGPFLSRSTVVALPRPFLAFARGAKRFAEESADTPRPKRRLSGKGPAERPPCSPADSGHDGLSKSSQWFRERLALAPPTPAPLRLPFGHDESRRSGTRPFASPNSSSKLFVQPAKQRLFTRYALEGVELQSSGDGLGHSCRWAWDRRNLSSSGPEWSSPQCQLQPQDGHRSLEATVGAINKRFDLFLEQFYRNHVAHEDNGKEACLQGERLSEEHYEEQCQSFVQLLHWTDHTESEIPPVDCLDGYVALEFQGCDFRCRHNADAENAELLATARACSVQGRARDALCAVAATLAARREKSWLEAFDVDFELAERQKELPKESVKERFDAVMADMALRGVRGYFAHGLVCPRSTFRFAVAKPAALGFPPRPASLLLTYRLPMIEALQQMDDCGPLPGDWPTAASAISGLTCPSGSDVEVEAAPFSTGSPSAAAEGSAWEFALQELDAHGRGGRQPLHLVCPEPGLSALLCPGARGRDVVLLDTLAALAPRSKSKEHGLSDIVKSELSNLLALAKSHGDGVIFMLGGEEPHVLAEKVYLRPPFTNSGLRCGYLRWREVGAKVWAKEKPQDRRVCIGLQLP